MDTNTTTKDNERTRGLRAALIQAFVTLRKAFRFLGSSLSLSLGTIFFIPQPWIGVILWLALLQNPRYAAFAILGIAIGAGIGKILRISHTPWLGGGLKANALLAALMVAWLTEALGISLASQLIMAVAAAAAASILAAAIMRALKGSNLPSLVWGYCIVAVMLFSIYPTGTVLATNAMPTQPIPHEAIDWIMTFFRSFGSFIYSPTYEAGLLVGLAILLWSRTMFITGTIGWISGVCTALAFEKLGITYYWFPTSYNYFIVGMAVGSVFFLPGRISLLLAVMGGAGASFLGLVLQHIWQGSSSAYLPITAATTIWVVMGAVMLAGSRSVVWLNHTPLLRPEEAWWHAEYWSQRFGREEPLLAVPVMGKLQVVQGFNGTLSHTGNWRHALDFQRPPPTDDIPEQVSPIWGAPVYSPAAGIIERINNNVPDNQLGVCNYAENWGNYVVIHLDQGGWAMLAHFQQGSIVVTNGMHVEAGAYLGTVGNSGRSPTPHLHLQAQNSPEPSAPTTPFRLVNYQSLPGTDGPLLHWNAAVPTEGEIVMAGVPNQMVHNVLASIAPGTAVWTVETQGRIPRSFRQPQSGKVFRINTTLDEAGRHLFSSDSGGCLVSSLAPDAWRVIEVWRLTSPFLKCFGLVAPSIPYAATVGMIWDDLVPIIPAGPASWLSVSAFPYRGKKPFTSSYCKCTSEPGLKSRAIQIETRLESRQASLPVKLTCQFEILRGPVKLQANFKDGTVVYSLLSFEPGLPFKNNTSQ